MSFHDRKRVAVWLDSGAGDVIKLGTAHEKIKPIERVLLLEYAEKMDRRKNAPLPGWSWVSDKTLSQRYGWASRTLEDARARLRQFGLLESRGKHYHRVTLPDEEPTTDRGLTAA
jgi:hypothetical protein